MKSEITSWCKCALIFLILVLNSYFVKACKSGGNRTPLQSLNKEELPGLVWAKSNFSTQQLIEKQLKVLEDFNSNMKILKGVTSTIGAVPFKPLSIPLKGVNELLFVLKSTIEIERQLTDLKISSEIHKIKLIELETEVDVIEERLSKANDATLKWEDRKAEILHAIVASDKIYSLFKNPKYLFYQNKMVSFPYLCTFATVFGVIGSYTLELRPDYIPKFEKRFVEMKKLIQDYATDAWIQRMKAVELKKIRSCYYKQYTKYVLNCQWYTREDSNKNYYRSSCYMPNEKESDSVGCRSKGWETRYPYPDIYDPVAGKTLCANDYEACYNSYTTKLKSEFHKLVSTTLKSFDDFNSKVQGSRISKPSESIDQDQGCTLNYFVASDSSSNYRDFQLPAFDALVCRVNVSGNTFPGNIYDRNCVFTNGNNAEKWSSNYEILAHTWSWLDSKKLKWKSCGQDGSIPSNAIPIGNVGSELLYVGRCFINDSVKDNLVTGYVNNGKIYVGYGYMPRKYECRCSASEILVCE